MSEKVEKKQKIDDIMQKLEQGIKDVYDSEKYKNYLTVMSKFYLYSYNNAMLIMMQKPDATRIAGFNAWKNNFKRHVNKGEKGIEILAPAPYKIKKELPKVDPITKKQILKPNGEIETEEVEMTIAAFKPVYVFDVSQTSGEPLPTLISELSGDVNQYNIFLESLKIISPFPIEFEEIENGAKGYCDYTNKKIAIKKGMSQLQSIKTAIHEIAHAELHSIDIDNIDNIKDPRTREVEAESVAFITANHFGINTSDYSFGYVAAWSSNKELSELKNSLKTIQNKSCELIEKIEKVQKEILKEQQNIESEKTASSLKLDPNKTPVVTIIFSEDSRLNEGDKFTIAQANEMFLKFDVEKRENRSKAGYEGSWYNKTSFKIEYTKDGELRNFEGRQDFGDADGSLIDHIKKYAEYNLNDPQLQAFLKGQGKQEESNAQYQYIINEFVPYLEIHNNLEKLEDLITSNLNEFNSIKKDEHSNLCKGLDERITYSKDMLNYIENTRTEINTSKEAYKFPDSPSLEDYLSGLNELKSENKDKPVSISERIASAKQFSKNNNCSTKKDKNIEREER